MYNFYTGRELILNAFKSQIFLTNYKSSGFLNTDNSKLKILTTMQTLQRLPIPLVQVKVGNNSKNLLNKFRQTVYYFYQSKETTKNYTIT